MLIYLGEFPKIIFWIYLSCNLKNLILIMY